MGAAGEGLPLATHRANIDFSQFPGTGYLTARISFRLRGVDPSDTALVGAGNTATNTRWIMAAQSGSASTVVGTDNGFVAMSVDGVPFRGNRGDLWSILTDGAADGHLVEVVGIEWVRAEYRFCRYPSAPTFDTRSGWLSDVRIDLGNTGVWDAHFPLTTITDTRDLVGSYAVTITAD